jgi:hypothetical protein
VKRLFPFVFAWGAVLAAAPFSHKLHLQMKLECTSCHSTALTSTQVQDNLLPAKEACQKCHAEVVIPGSPTTIVAKFNHSLHLRMGNIAPIIAAAIDHRGYLQPAGDIRQHLNSGNACQACHRGMAESEQVTRANLPQMADCLVCHTAIRPPFSCQDCHAKGTELRPSSHLAATFVDSHSSRTLFPDKTSCTVCHGRGFTCMGCH